VSLNPACSSQNIPRRLAVIALLTASLPLMTGCASLFVSKRKLLQPIAPPSVQTATADELVAGLNQKWAKFESLTATVDIRASHLKTKEGVATDYPSFRANLLLRKPDMLRILGKLPVVQTTMFDLASDGKSFTLLIPPKSKAYQGLNASKGTSPNWYENLRPSPLFSAMVVKGLNADELYSVTSDSSTEEDPAKKRLLQHPEYILNIVRRKPYSQELYPVRVVTFHREDLLPYEQDLYDEAGVLQTQVLYNNYQQYEGLNYPSKITLKRPQEEYELVMTVERVTPNPTLTDDQFQAKIPPEYTVQELK
jgi:outer membrane lipoprotein-sorting protein